MSTKSNVQLRYCRCPDCLTQRPDTGLPQKQQTIANHMKLYRSANDIGASERSVPQPYSVPPCNLSSSPSSRFGSPMQMDYNPRSFDSDDDDPHTLDLFDRPVDDTRFLGPLDDQLNFSSDSELEYDSRDYTADRLEDEDELPAADSDNNNTDDEGGNNENFHIADVAADPLFQTRASLFDEDRADPDDKMDTPWAFDDHPAVRHAYISAFVSAASTVSATSTYYPGLENFALTLPTVEKCLGLSTDSIITYVFLCDACWMPHLPELSQLESPHCNQPACEGTLYTTSGKKSRNGTEKRTPTLTMPFAPPEKVIERMCLQPGKVQQWQHWRRPDDTVGICAPSTLKGMEAFDDPDKPMLDITDGWGWHVIQGGLERRHNGKWEVKDVDVKNLNQRFVAFPNGLVAQINVDWFQAVDGACHSTDAMYMTICNNPRGI
ncbi:hypothetical protein C8F01DRAFT_1366529 [Mycena amicta]|nr:hypothetical protein C8F01DRAFT_1366529 [Mycena amicta]